MKKLLLILACGIFCANYAFSGLDKVVEKYAPHLDAETSTEDLQHAVNNAFAKMKSLELLFALEFCVLQDEFSFVSNHIGKLKEWDLSLLLSKCVEKEQMGLVEQHVENLEGRALACMLSSCVEQEKMEFVHAHIGRLDEIGLADVLCVCAEQGQMQIVRDRIEHLKGENLASVLRSCVERAEGEFIKQILNTRTDLFDNVDVGEPLLLFLKEEGILAPGDLQLLLEVIKKNVLHALKPITVKPISKNEAARGGREEAILEEKLEQETESMRWWTAAVYLVKDQDEIKADLQAGLKKVKKAFHGSGIDEETMQRILKGITYTFKYLPKDQHLALITAVKEETFLSSIKQELQKTLEYKDIVQVTKKDIIANIAIQPEVLRNAVNLDYYTTLNGVAQNTHQVLNRLAENLRAYDLPGGAIRDRKSLGVLYRSTQKLDQLQPFDLKDTFCPMGLLALHYQSMITDGNEGSEDIENYPGGRCADGLSAAADWMLNDLYNIPKNINSTKDFDCHVVR